MKDANAVAAGLLLGYVPGSKGDEQNSVPQAKTMRTAGLGQLFKKPAWVGCWNISTGFEHFSAGD